MTLIEIAGHAVIFLFGFGLVIWTILSVLRTFVLPRSINTLMARSVFLAVWALFSPFIYRMRTYPPRDRLLSMFAPSVLFVLPLAVLTLIWLGYAAMFWGISAALNPREALIMSGSSLMTLGFKFVDELP